MAAANHGRRVLWSLGIGAGLLGLLALASWAHGTTAAGHVGWLSLAPAAITITLAFVTRQVIVALLLGIASGGVVYAFAASAGTTWTTFPWGRLNALQTFLLPEIGSPAFAIILVVYLWSLGGLIGLWARTGGAEHFADVMGRRLVRGPRSARVFTWILGIIFHQGGTISTVLAGTTARPLLDKHRISKEESTYLVDSTSSPVATVLPFNVFPFVVAGVVAGTIPIFQTASGAPDFDAGVAFYLRALGWNFYGWLAIILTLLFALGWFPALGGMRKARARVEGGGPLVRPGAEPLSSAELSEVETLPGYKTGLVDFLLPLSWLLGIAVVPFLIQRGLGNPTELYIVEAFLAAVVVAAVVAIVKGMPARDAMDAVTEGAKGVTPAAIILGLAVSMKGVADALGTGPFVADLLDGLPAGVLPMLLMIGAFVVAFSTGTSFGTFAVLFPVAMPLAWAILPGSEAFVAACFGAVLSGSVLGDQCSPISDTTILSSLALGADLMDHVKTQIPMAAVAGGSAAALFLATGLVLF